MITYTIPLGNFIRQDQSTCELGDARIIASKNLQKVFLEYIMESFAKRKELIDINPPKCYLQMDLADEVLKNDETRRRPLDRTLVIFKLFKDGLVKSNIVFVQNRGKINSLLWRHYVRWTHPETKVPAYILKRVEEPFFRKFWREFTSIDVTNFAVYRFHLADFRPYLRDRFADYVESLEYLLVPDSGEGEIGYKFRTRGALTLSSPKGRGRVYEDLDDAYDLRSAVVHGVSEREAKILRNRGDTEIKGWEEMIRLTRNYDRRLITLFFRGKCYKNREMRRKYLVERSMCIS
jgi:hypothetical protein